MSFMIISQGFEGGRFSISWHQSLKPWSDKIKETNFLKSASWSNSQSSCWKIPKYWCCSTKFGTILNHMEWVHSTVLMMKNNLRKFWGVKFVSEACLCHENAEDVQQILTLCKNWSGARFLRVKWGMVILRKFFGGKITLRNPFRWLLNRFSKFWHRLKSLVIAKLDCSYDESINLRKFCWVKFV